MKYILLTDFFLCDPTIDPIPRTFVCDGVVDCENEKDESEEAGCHGIILLEKVYFQVEEFIL